MEEFYIVLPSNTPVPGNTASNFTVRLPHTLELDSSWTVALSSIIYPHSFATLGMDEDEYVRIKAVNPSYRGQPEEKPYRFIEIPIPSMQFKTIAQMQNTLNGLIKKGFEEAGKEEVTASRQKRSTAQQQQKERSPTPEKERPQQPDRSPERETPTDEKELEKEEPEKDLEREAEIKDAEMERGTPSSNGSQQAKGGDDKLLTDQEKGIVLQEVIRAGIIAEGIPGETYDQQSKNNTLSLTDQARLNTAKGATERAWIAATKLRNVIEEMMEKSKQDKNMAEAAARNALNAPEVRDLFNKIEEKMRGIKEIYDNFTDEFNKIEKSKNVVNEYFAQGKLKEARIEADKAKLAFQHAKQLSLQLGDLYWKAEPETEIGVKELANRIQTFSSSILEKMNNQQSVPEKEPVKEIEEKEPERESDTIEKELEKEQKTTITIEKQHQKVPAMDIQHDSKRPTTKKQDEERKQPTTSPAFPSYEEESEQTTLSSSKTNATSSPKSTNIIDIKEIQRGKDEQFPIEPIYEPDSTSYLPFLPLPQKLVQQSTTQHEDDDEDELTDAEWVAKKGREKGEKWVYEEHSIANIDEKKIIEFRYNEMEQRFFLYFGDDIHFIDVSKQLAYVLGFENTRIYELTRAKYSPDLSGGIKQMYVYAPKLVENTIIGDRMAPLLRVVNLTSSPEQDVPEVIYTNEFFHPLQNKRISEIRIEIQSAFGQYLKFHWGTCVLTLHFKRRLF